MTHALGARTEPYRVLGDRAIARELAAIADFACVSVHRQFVLPIALHKAIGSPRFTTTLAGALGPPRPAASVRHHRSRSWPNGARSSHRRDRVHRRPPGARAGRGAAHQVRALVRDPRSRAPAADLARPPASRGSAIGDLQRSTRRSSLRDAPCDRRRGRLPHRGALPAGRRVGGHLSRGQRRPPSASWSEQSARAGVRRVVHCSTVGVHGDIEHPPANEDAPLRPGDVYQRTKVEGEAARAERRRPDRASRSSIARPSGIYGPGDRRLLKLFGGDAHGIAFRSWAAAKSIYHLTYIDDLVRGLSPLRRASGRGQIAPTSWPAAK